MQTTRKGCHSQCMGFSASLLSQTHTHTKIIVPEVHFHTESIAASPVVIGQKTAKLFKFLYWPTQRGPTTVFPYNLVLSAAQILPRWKRIYMYLLLLLHLYFNPVCCLVCTFGNGLGRECYVMVPNETLASLALKNMIKRKPKTKNLRLLFTRTVPDT